MMKVSNEVSCPKIVLRIEIDVETLEIEVRKINYNVQRRFVKSWICPISIPFLISTHKEKIKEEF